MPSLREFAQSYGVGNKLIHLALQELAADGRIVMRPGRPTLAAIGLPLSSIMQNVIALILISSAPNMFEDSNYKAIYDGIIQGLHGRECPPLLLLHHHNRWRTEFPAGLRELPLKAILLMGPFRPELLQQYEKMGFPVVLLDQPGEKWDIHSVAVANYDAAFAAASRLIQLGHRRIAFIRGVVHYMRAIDPDSKERQDGFVAACEKAGLKPSQFKIVTTGADLNSPAVDALIRAAPRFTAILTANHGHTHQVAIAAESAGLKIPRDLSVAGIHGYQPLSRNWSGPQIDFLELGRMAALLVNAKPGARQHVRIQTAWNNGDSVAKFHARR